MIAQAQMQHSTSGSTLADILERVLDKGIVIAGDIKIKLVDIELLTIQVRLIIASVDKAKELGMDWWMLNPALSSKAARPEQDSEVAELKRRLEKLETREAAVCAPPVAQASNA
jgi:Gas vesicle protein